MESDERFDKHPDSYFGKYARLFTSSKKEGAALVNANNLVGDYFSIEFVVKDGHNIAWMLNKFGERIAFFDRAVSRELSLCAARSWVLQALLSYVTYEDVQGGVYGGEAALVCFDPRHEQTFSQFTARVAKRLVEGIRPKLELDERMLRRVISSEGTWQPKETVPLPPKRKGVALVKTRRNFTERLVEQGRARNKGCYAGSVLFLAAILAGLVLLLRSCGLF